MLVRMITVAFALVLLAVAPSRADTVKAASVVSGPPTLEAVDVASPALDPYLQPQLLTIDANGLPSASPEINVLFDALSLPEPPASFGIGRALLVLMLALGTFVAVKVAATLWQRHWEHGRIAHF